MTLKYLGHASFLLKSKSARIITDPFDSKIGLKFPKQEADIVTISHGHDDHSNLSAVSGNPLVINLPGEFEKNGVRIYGFGSYHDKNKGADRGENIVYKIEADGVSIVHCGDWGVVPDDDFVDNLGDVDILLLPVGGHYTVDAAEATEIVKKIEPSIVIPMHYNRPELDQKVFGALTSVDDFIKKIGTDTGEPVDQLTVKKEELQGDMKVIVMSISS